MRIRRARHSLELLARRVQERLGVGWRGLLGLGLGLSMAVAALLTFGAVADAVSERDGLSTGDAAHLAVIVRHRSPVWVAMARVFSTLGSIEILAAVAVVAAVVLWWRTGRAALAAAPAAALAAGAVAAAIGKAIVDRPRPPVALHLVAESSASFPSGHSTDSTAFFLALAAVLAVVLFRRAVLRAVTVAVGGLLALAVGLSRLELGVHWPTDVLGGWTLGLAVASVIVTGATLIAHARE
jgi:undecaprenyl-diphosphatase